MVSHCMPVSRCVPPLCAAVAVCSCHCVPPLLCSKHTTLLGAASQPPPRAPGARYNAGGSTYVSYKMKVGCTIVVHWRNHKQWTC